MRENINERIMFPINIAISVTTSITSPALECNSGIERSAADKGRKPRSCSLSDASSKVYQLEYLLKIFDFSDITKSGKDNSILTRNIFSKWFSN